MRIWGGGAAATCVFYIIHMKRWKKKHFLWKTNTFPIYTLRVLVAGVARKRKGVGSERSRRYWCGKRAHTAHCILMVPSPPKAFMERTPKIFWLVSSRYAGYSSQTSFFYTPHIQLWLWRYTIYVVLCLVQRQKNVFSFHRNIIRHYTTYECE